ncbi:MAG: DUF4982 domain-containing protein, partial [Kiritimatiellota bacterium]|nr:DUF4982 domain-containing protein [Kiritimatiellota bacterium]
FIHPHYWRSQYLGQKKDFIVNSNCESVELKANGKSLGKLTPSAKNHFTVTFKDVAVEKGALIAETHCGNKVTTHKLVMAGPAAKLALSASHIAISAARDSVFTVLADITDAAGNHVYGATNTLIWSVTGPAMLVGPGVYVSDIDKKTEMEGAMYIDAPVGNILRSTGKPGSIIVTVSADGLAPAQLAVTAQQPASDAIAGITEPPLDEAGRLPVVRQPGYAAAQSSALKKIKESPDDIRLEVPDLPGYARQIESLLRKRNPKVARATPQFKSLVDAMAKHMMNTRGEMIRDDYNFLVGQYNRLISQ